MFGEQATRITSKQVDPHVHPKPSANHRSVSGKVAAEIKSLFRCKCNKQVRSET